MVRTKALNGIVSDDSGKPLPGVTVIVKDTSNGTTTDFDGKFNLTATTGDSIVLSYVGLKRKK